MLSSLYLNYICENKILIDLNPRNDLIPTTFANVTYFYIEINRHILYIETKNISSMPISSDYVSKKDISPFFYHILECCLHILEYPLHNLKFSVANIGDK